MTRAVPKALGPQQEGERGSQARHSAPDTPAHACVRMSSPAGVLGRGLRSTAACTGRRSRAPGLRSALPSPGLSVGGQVPVCELTQAGEPEVSWGFLGSAPQSSF